MQLGFGECQLPLPPPSCHPSACLVLTSYGRQLGFRSWALGQSPGCMEEAGPPLPPRGWLLARFPSTMTVLERENPFSQPGTKQEAHLSEPSYYLFKSGKLSEQTQRPEKTRVTQEASHWQCGLGGSTHFPSQPCSLKSLRFLKSFHARLALLGLHSLIE